MMHIGRTNTGHLNETHKEKHLGILVTRHLKPTALVTKAAPSVNCVLGRINNTFTWGGEEGFLKLNTGKARPHTREHSLKLHQLTHTTRKRNMFFTTIINECNKLILLKTVMTGMLTI